MHVVVIPHRINEWSYQSVDQSCVSNCLLPVFVKKTLVLVVFIFDTIFFFWDLTFVLQQWYVAS